MEGGSISKIIANFFLVLISASFIQPILSAFAIDKTVVINEVAWMGTARSANDEWIELHNLTSTDIDLTGWILKAADGSPNITLHGIIVAQGFFLLERTSDDTVSGILADQIYTGSLGNSGEYLQLINSVKEVLDEVDAHAGWPAGDNATKQTFARTVDATYLNSIEINGTPKAINFVDSDPSPDAGSGSSALDDVTDFLAVPSDGLITLNWNNPASFSGILVLQSTGAIFFVPQNGSGYLINDIFLNEKAVYAGSGSDLIISGLLNGSEYFFKIWVYDKDYKYSKGISISAVPFPAPPIIDTIPPADVTNLQIVSSNSEIVLSWMPPQDSDFVSVRIVRSKDAYPQNCQSGDLVFENNSATGFTDKNLINNQTYYYRICAYDSSMNFSTGVIITAQPFAIPDVIFSEIAWAGSSKSSADEWLELRNMTDVPIDISGWQIQDEVKNATMLVFSERSIIGTGSHFLISNYAEKTENTVLNVKPDVINNDISLSNSELQLTLRNGSGEILDFAGNGKSPFAGSSGERFASMQRNLPIQSGMSADSWSNSLVSANFQNKVIDFGTPGLENKFIDDISPAQVTDLRAIQMSSGALLLFSQSRDDRFSGDFASRVEIFSGSGSSLVKVGETEGDKTEFLVLNAEANNWFMIRAQDNAGNYSNFSNPAQLTLDQLPPILSFSPDLTDKVVDDSVRPLTLKIASDDLLAQVSCSESGMSALMFAGSGFLTLNSSGAIKCSATDLAGNQSEEKIMDFTFSDLANQVVFSEILPNPSGTDSQGEWIELYNRYSGAVSLAGWKITNGNDTYIFPDDVAIGSGGYLFLAAQTSEISLRNSGTETLELLTSGNKIIDTFSRSGTAPQNQSWAKNFRNNVWQWTKTLTPGLSNIINAPNASFGVADYSSYGSTMASQINLKIKSVSFDNPNGDFVEFQCLDCGPFGANLSGWSLHDSNEILVFPIDFVVQTGDIFRLEFKAKIASNLQNKILRTADSGLVSTDAHLILQDSYGLVEDALCWANQDLKWSSTENRQVANLIMRGGWHANSRIIDETACADSHLIHGLDLLERKDINVDTNFAGDWATRDYIVASSSSGATILALLSASSEAKTVSTGAIIDYSGLRFSEIFPNPKGKDKSFEWIEIQNVGQDEIVLTGLEIRSGKRKFIFPERIVSGDEFIVLHDQDLKFSLPNTSGSLKLLDSSGRQIDSVLWDKVPEDQSWIKFNNGWYWSKTSTAGKSNIYYGESSESSLKNEKSARAKTMQKRKANKSVKKTKQGNSVPILKTSLFTLKSIKSGKWILTSGWVIIPPQALAKDTMWITDSKSFARVNRKSLQQFKVGDFVFIKGKVSHTKSNGTQILASAKGAYIVINKQAKQMDRITPAVINKIDKSYLNQIVTTSGAVLNVRRNILDLDNGIKINIGKVKNAPILAKGDKVEVIGLVMNNNSAGKGFVIVPWDLAQIKFTVVNENIVEQQLSIDKKGGSLIWLISLGVLIVFGIAVICRKWFLRMIFGDCK
ncbi:MAG: lamin tail domain-containing protein [Patescibacteria group bacterium]|nr:lamin tail domain-containing protein [Patescibacteria group bacterium]